MNDQDFTTTIVVEQTPEQVFNSINDPRAWWSGEFEGDTDKLNDEFTYRYKEFHLSKQRVVELVPGEKVVWLVTESRLNFTEDPNEWTGTKIIFEISDLDNKTQLRFTHQGLTPRVECFNDCSNGWTKIIREGFYSLITTGEGERVYLG